MEEEEDVEDSEEEYEETCLQYVEQKEELLRRFKKTLRTLK